MVNHALTQTKVALGYSDNPSDGFQGGREAAQMAKSQLQESNPNLVLVFGPPQNQFKAVLEGVRLVVGESKLVGIPTNRVISTNVSHPDAFVVVMIQSLTNQFTIGINVSDTNGLIPGITSLLTKIEENREYGTNKFRYKGYLLFDTINHQGKISPSHRFAFESGINSWILGAKPLESGECFMAGQDQFIQEGLLGIECLSHDPWGTGQVTLQSFQGHPGIYQESVTTAVRDAQHHMKGHPAAFGILLFNFPLQSWNTTNVQDVFQKVDSVAPGVPFIGFSTEYQYLRTGECPHISQKESVTTVLFPE